MGQLSAYHHHSNIACMSPDEFKTDELLDAILEDERAAALQELRERDERK